MKKLATLFLAAGLLFSSATGAQAVDFKTSGEWDVAFSSFDGFKDGTKDENNNFTARQRLRWAFIYNASENLTGMARFDLGFYEWGQNVPLAGSGTINVNWAWIDWRLPSTDIRMRMGLQHSSLVPMYITDWRNVLHYPGTGIITNIPYANTVTSIGWIRAQANMNEAHAEADLFGINTTVKLDGFQITPWFLYAAKGGNTASNIMVNKNKTLFANYQTSPANGDVDAYFLGLAAKMTRFDPFALTMEGYYSAANMDHRAGMEKPSGWFVAYEGTYKTSNGTPTLKGWYSSGDQKDETRGSGQPLSIAPSFEALAVMFCGGVGAMNGGIVPRRSYASGTYGVIAEWTDFTFMENLKNTFRVAYVQGTNESGRTDVSTDSWREYMTTKDKFWEVDWISKYQIYKNFETRLCLGYAWVDFEDKDVTDKWRATLSFKWTF